MHHWRKGGAVTLFNYTKEAGGRIASRFAKHKSKVHVHAPKKGGSALTDAVTHAKEKMPVGIKPGGEDIRVLPAQHQPGGGPNHRKRIMAEIQNQFNKKGKR
jgi:hypothetical protein